MTRVEAERAGGMPCHTTVVVEPATCKMRAMPTQEEQRRVQLTKHWAFLRYQRHNVLLQDLLTLQLNESEDGSEGLGSTSTDPLGIFEHGARSEEIREQLGAVQKQIQILKDQEHEQKQKKEEYQLKIQEANTMLQKIENMEDWKRCKEILEKQFVPKSTNARSNLTSL